MIFNGLKLEGACAGGIAGGSIGTVTGARRGFVVTSSLILTTVTSSGSSLAGKEPDVLVTLGDAARFTVIPAAIVKSSISSATFW
jgi:hypothetical protein